jgi:D-inositol-3-phosphate glycosyltransferase
MNVYVRELVSALAHAGLDCTTYTRAWRPGLPQVVGVEPNHRVVHIEAGDYDLPKNDLVSVVDSFADGVRDHIAASGGTDVLHGNYWLSGIAGHRLKHELDLPLVMTFHTFARVKAQGGDPEPVSRENAESSIIGSTGRQRGRSKSSHPVSNTPSSHLASGVVRATPCVLRTTRR